MNTFLPFPDFEKSAKVLDRLRLGKQRSEALIMLRGGWVNHPAAKMWSKHLYQLANYGIAICNEWISRGYRDNCLKQFLEEQSKLEDAGVPWWLGNQGFHISHQSNLIRKLPEHYGPIFPGVPDNLPYIWPVP